MGIRVDFLIKHIRPYGMDAWRMLTAEGEGTLVQWMRDNGVSVESIGIAINAWATTADLPIENGTLPQFVQSASLISQARWDELYTTSKSTILFLDGPLLKELSFTSQQRANQEFEFRPAEYIPLAVTIHKDNSPAQANTNVNGARLKADENGHCFHFAGLIL